MSTLFLILCNNWPSKSTVTFNSSLPVLDKGTFQFFCYVYFLKKMSSSVLSGLSVPLSDIKTLIKD